MNFREQCKEIKEHIPIAQVAKVFLKLSSENGVLRAPCPACKEGGDRAIVVTPSKGVFFCFASKKGGSVIDLVAHVKGISAQEAVDYLSQEKEEGFDYQKYRDSLGPVEGLDPALTKSLGIGIPNKGVHKGRVAFPLFDENGKFLVYASASDIRLPKRWRP